MSKEIIIKKMENKHYFPGGQTIIVNCKKDIEAVMRAYKLGKIHGQIETRSKEKTLKIELTERDLLLLKSLRDICIEEDLLDLQSYDSIARAIKINNTWQALKVIEKILKEQINEKQNNKKLV